jgi:hypothetical protein
MAFVYVNIKARLGNQMFQFWVGKWLAEQLNRKLKVFINEPFQITSNIYSNLGIYYTSEWIRVQDNPEIGHYIFKSGYDANTLDISKIVEFHKDKQFDIFIDYYLEDYSIIKPNESWVKELYSRAPESQLTCNNSLVVHLRLGDVASDTLNTHGDYVSFTCSVAEEKQLPVIIVTEELNNYCTQTLYHALISKGLQVSIANNNLDEYQKDFDVLASAKVIVAGNSTFSWWASFINPFNPDVYVALSDRQPQPHRNETLFKRESPDGWKLWDMDSKIWIKK